MSFHSYRVVLIMISVFSFFSFLFVLFLCPYSNGTEYSRFWIL